MPRGKPKDQYPEMYRERVKLQAEKVKEENSKPLFKEIAFSLKASLKERGLFHVVRYVLEGDKVIEERSLCEADSKPLCIRVLINAVNQEFHWPVELGESHAVVS